MELVYVQASSQLVHLTLHAVHGVMKPKAEEVINKRESVNKNQNKKNKKIEKKQ